MRVTSLAPPPTPLAAHRSRNRERAREVERLQLRQVAQRLDQCSAGLNAQLVVTAHGAYARRQTEWWKGEGGKKRERRARAEENVDSEHGKGTQGYGERAREAHARRNTR